jgi:molecular chaperone HtpG
LLEGSRSERGATFVRVDSSAMDEIIEKDEPARESVLSEVEQNQILDVFKGIFKEKDAEKGEATNVELRPLSPEDSPVQITRTEFIRRMQEMQQLAGGSMFGNIPDTFSIIINSNHPVVAKTMLATDDKDGLAKYLYDTALLNQGMLKGAELTDFVNRTLKYVAK